MAQLSSPGVSVTVVDESFYTPAAPGTVPLIIVASQANKMNSAGTGIAPGTLPANAGTVYLLTSQADLGATFGVPYFQTDAENNPINAGELNEYGLQAAYSFLGVSNRAYVVRANLDTSQLLGSTAAPTSPPADGTYWFDLADTNFGVFQWNGSSASTTTGTTSGQTFTNQQTASNLSVITDPNLVSGTTPLASYGQIGDYAVVSTTTLNTLWYKKALTDTAAGTWVQVGTTSWAKSWPTFTSLSVASNASITGTFVVNGSTITASSSTPAQVAGLINSASITGVTAAYVNSTIQIYSTGVNVVIGSGTITGTTTAPGTYGLIIGTYLAPQLQISPHYAVPLYGTYDSFVAYGTNNAGQTSVAGAPTGSIWIKTTPINSGANYFIKKYNAATSTWITQPTQLFGNNQSAMATLDPTGGGINIPVGTVYVKYNDAEFTSPYANFKIYERIGTGATNTTSSPITSSTFPAVVTSTASAYGIIGNGSNSGSGTIFTPTGTVTGTYATGMVLSGTGVTSGTTISTINTATAITATTGATMTASSTTTTSGNITISTFSTYTLAAGMPVVVTGTTSQGIAPGTYYIIGSPTSTAIQLSATKGGAGITTTVGSISGLTFTLAVLNVTAVTGTLSVGQVLSGGAVTAGTYINALIGGSGSTGTYALNQAATGAPTTATSYTVSVSQSVSTASNTITGTSSNETYAFTIAESQIGSSSLTSAVTVTWTATGAITDAGLLLTAFSAAVTDPNIIATLNTSTNVITFTHKAGGDLRLVDGQNTPLAKLFTVGTSANFYTDPTGNANSYIVTQWASTVNSTAVATPSFTALTTTPVNGQLWYDTNLDADIMVNNGTSWVGYLNYTQNQVGGGTTDPMGPIFSSTTPTVQSGGLPLANGDLWIDPQYLEQYPMIYKYNYLTKSWILINNEDHTSSQGIIFADARWGIESASTTQTGTVAEASIVTLLSSNFVDFDCPNPALYPKGTLLWNTRRSGFNVKQYVTGYVNVNNYNTIFGNVQMKYYAPDRWVTYSPNDVNGVGQFGRKAQRSVVLKALNATIQANQNIRQPDTVIFNLLSCPGYLETVSELVSLNNDNGLTAFIVADSPARLAPDATSLSNWGNNVNQAAVDGDNGLIVTDPYTAVYYPWGYTTDLTGNNIVVPPSHIMLRTIALSDNVSYPWFAPAGVRRGGVTNASSVGYVDPATGEFVTVALNTGQRDTLAAVHVNPITYIAGTGLVVYGQKTRQLVASSLDRINVARLVVYLRYQLNQLAKPFIFEPNDTITRNEIKQQVEKLMLELTAERALYDYIVVCDTSNNTPSRIDQNELYVDIAIEPVKAVEFIYIPLRLENTGAIKALGLK